MSIYSYINTDIQQLIEQLKTDIEKHQSNLWEPIYIVIPNYNIKNFLNLYLSKKMNIVANIRYLFWDQLSVHYLKEVHNLSVEIQSPQITMLQCMEQIHLLLKNNNGYLQTLHHYLKYTDPGIQQREIYNLSNLLLDIYQDIHIHRPDILEVWQQKFSSNNYLYPKQKSIEYIQRTIYQKLFNTANSSKTHLTFVTKSHLLHYVNNIFLKNSPKSLLKNLFIFPITTLSVGYISLLDKISNTYQVFLYQLKQPLLKDEIGNKEISYTRVSFKTSQLIELVCKSSPIIESTSSSPDQNKKPNNLLFQIQNYTLGKQENVKITEPILKESSFILLETNNQFYEIQSIYNSILIQTQDKTVLYHDIAILTYNLDTYLPIIQEVFEHQYLKIPYVCLEPQIKSSQIFNFITDYLLLISMTWNQTTFLKLLSNPIVQTSLSLATQNISHIQQCLKSTHTIYESSEKEKNQHSFSFFLKRLVLSQIYMSDFNNTLFDEPFNGSVDGYIPYSNLYLQSQEFYNLFIEILRRLLHSHKILNSKISHSKIYLIEQDLNYFCSFSSLNENEKVCFKKIENNLSILREEEKKRVIYIEEIQVFIEEMCQNYKLAPSRKNLMGGIIVGSLESLYQVPFDTLYIVGMHEKSLSSSQETLFHLNQKFSSKENSQTDIAKLSKVERIDLLQSFILYAIQQTQKRVILSYSKYDHKENILLKAPIINDLKNIIQKTSNYIPECILAIEIKKEESIFQEFLFQEIPEYLIQQNQVLPKEFLLKLHLSKTSNFKTDNKNHFIDSTLEFRDIKEYTLSPLKYLLKDFSKKTEIEYYEKIYYISLDLEGFEIPIKHVIQIMIDTIQSISLNPKNSIFLTRTMYKKFFQILKKLRLQSKIPCTTTMFQIARKQFLSWCSQAYKKLNLLISNLEDDTQKHFYASFSFLSNSKKYSYYKYQNNNIKFDEPYIYYSKNFETIHLSNIIFINKLTSVKELFQAGILSALQQYALQHSSLHNKDIKKIQFNQIIINKDLTSPNKVIAFYQGDFLYPLSQDETDILEKLHEHMMDGSCIYFDLEQLRLTSTEASESIFKNHINQKTFHTQKTTYNMINYFLQQHHNFFTDELTTHQKFSHKFKNIMEHRFRKNSWIEISK